MAGSVNKVTLLGNLGQDPEVVTFSNGGRVVKLSVATSESWKDKQSGEKREKTEWHRVSIFSEGLGGVAERYLRKGSKVYLVGQLETRKYTDKDGVERYTTEVMLRPFNSEMVLLDSRNGNGHDPAHQQPADWQAPSGYQPKPQQPAAKAVELDDEIPF